MAFDAAKPAGSQKIRLSDEEIRANWAALEDAWNREHIFPGAMGGTAGQHKFPVEAALPTGAEGRTSIHNNLWYFFANGAWRTLIPPGTKMLFLQAAAPTGWTQDVSVNDRVFRLTSGAGAVTGGDWNFTGVTVQGHQLTIAEMPGHDHIAHVGASTVNNGTSGGLATAPGDTSTTSRGGDGSHTHPGLTNSSWRPAYVDVIACTKN